MNYKLYHALSGLNEIEASWLELVKNVTGVQFYQMPQWYKAYLQHLSGPDRNIFFVTAFEGETLHFILPLVQRSIQVHGFKFNVLQSPSHNHMSLGGGLCSGHYLLNHNILSLYQFLRSHDDLQWDWIYFKKAVAGTDLHKLIENSPFKNDYRKHHAKSYYIDCSHDLECSFKNIKTKFKRNLRRQERKAQQLGALTFEVLEGEQLVDFIDEFLELEASGWKGQSQTSILSHPDLVLFYRLLIKYHNQYNRCILNTLRLNGDLIAAQLGIINGTTMNLLKIAYSENISNVAPGSMLLFKAIKYCTEQPEINELCFVTGPKWAEIWKTGERDVYSYLLFNKTIKGRISHVYTWIKHLLASAKRFSQ